MYDRGDTKADGKQSKAATSQSERREANRHPLIASADVVELHTGSRFSTRTTDLGPGGCFLDTLIPFESGSKVRVLIRDGQNRFEATGIVVYSQSGLGMGVAFDPLKPEQRRSLAIWLGEEVDEHPGDQDQPHSPQSELKPRLPHGSDHEALLRLVKLMISKGILSQAEAASIFGNPVLF